MSPLLLGMISCESDDGGIALPAAGKGGSGANGGSSGIDGSGDTGNAQAGVDGLAGNGSGGTTTEGTGGTSGTGAKGGKGGSGGSSTSHTGGTHATGTGGSDATGGSSDTGGTSAAAEGGMGGEPGMNETAGAGNTPGEGGTGGSPDQVPVKLCLFHTPPAIAGGGEGGAAPAPTGVAVATNAFVGPYLTDLNGMTLYIYGADVPGDCNNPPVTNCTADCTQSWPVFDAGERHLDATLDDGAFGTFDRGGGVFQTTYYGWPLYRYKSDTTANTINGQGKGKTWFAAETELPNLMIMRGPVSGGGVKYLSDDKGHTLYSLSGDTLGGTGVTPKSACTGPCLDAFIPFAPGAVYPVTSIEPHDVELFFRADGTLQTAYKGAPLYFAKGDVKAGETNGLTLFGGALVAP